MARVARVARVHDLRDCVIAITRNEQEAREFSDLVQEQGGRAIAIPATQIVPAGAQAGQEFLALLKKKKHDYCAFMSAQAAGVLVNLIGAEEARLALKGTTKVIAVGPKTRQELEKHGISVDLMPERYSSMGLVDMLARQNPSGKRIIIPRSSEAGEFATKALHDLGMTVDEISLYGVRTHAGATPSWQEFRRLLAGKKIDAIVFTSASNVRSFFEIMHDPDLAGVSIISIGPFTSAELRRKNLDHFEASDHTIKGTVDVARELFKGRQA
ncbi:MAG: uroporphyrinogen-III synthase [Nitrososphaera sp.]